MRPPRNLIRPILLLCLIQIFILSGCGKQRKPADIINRVPVNPTGFHGQEAFEEVRLFLAVGSRPSGSPGAAKATGHIVQRLAEAGLQPVVDTFTNMTPAGPRTFRNITAVLPGARPGMVIIGSHFDTKDGIGEDFGGANDSGSSTGLLLALMRFYRTAKGDKPTIMAAFFDGEECIERYGPEDGLHGSRRLARQLAANPGSHPPILGVFVLDMVGDKNLFVSIPRNSSSPLIHAVFSAATDQGTRAAFSLLPGGILDDHLPFIEAGFPAIDIIDFNYGTPPHGNEYWHTTGDTLDKLSPQSLEIVGRVTIGAINFMNP